MDTRKNAQYFQTTTQLSSLHSCILWGLSEGGVHSARADGRARARRPTRVRRTMEFTVCVSRGVDGDISTEVTRGGVPPGHAVTGGFFLGPYPLGPLGREGLDEGLDFGCFMSSLFGAISRRIVRPPPDIPPPEGVADLPIVRELVVRALAARVVADSTSFLPLTDPDFDPYRGSLKALGRLACVSRGYRDDTNDPYVVTRLLDGVAAPKWRDWAKAWRGVNDPEKRLETPQTPNPRTGLHRLTLGDVHALLRAEHVAKYVIDASNVAHFDEHALPERVTWRPSTLRASVAFPPPPEPAPEPNPVIPEGLQKVREEIEKVRPKFTADVERNVELMRERDALADELERNGEALREKFESRADRAGDVFVAAALLKPELPSAHLEEDDRLHTVKKVSLEKSFEEVQQASFDRTDSHDLYSKYIPMSVEELRKQLTRDEISVSYMSNLTDGGKLLRDRIQLLKELIPLKERENEIDRDRAARGARPRDNTTPFEFVYEVENGQGRPRRTEREHKVFQQKQLDEHRMQYQRNYHLMPQKVIQKVGRCGTQMLAAAQAYARTFVRDHTGEVGEVGEVMSISPDHATPGEHEPDVNARNDLAVYALCNRVCARFHACATEPRFPLVFDTPPHLMFNGMVFFVETQRTETHSEAIRDAIGHGGEVIVGKFIFMFAWAIRLTSCFVYRRLRRESSHAPDR